jgi:hypothetical protein
MFKKNVTVIFALAILLCMVAAHGRWAQAAGQHDFGAERKDSLVHCCLNSSILAGSAVQPHSEKLHKVLAGFDDKIDSVVLVGAWFKDHPPFREPFSQQDLFKFEEVYRL